MPTYGKVKVNFLTHDVSGSAVELAVNNIATKASPTFTGTVTVPTPSADDNSTKAASTAYVQTELGDYALKASPTFTGTVTVPTPTAGDNSTKAASTAFVVASFAPLAAPAFTGNATGVNLTLSGNLTVNGTTTTIDTTTLQVEDKNIEIGKVSSPSDTTADGGGWTLKGATDKTFNWVNSTDAWTSSEHIQVASGKTFIGDGSTLTALNASNIASGTIAAARVPTLNQNTTGSAATVTGAAQSAITSLGTLTGLTVDGDLTLTGASVNCVWDKSDNALEFADSAKAAFGTGSDLEIYHDGSHSILKNSTGYLALASDLFVLENNARDENLIVASANGSVDLMYDNVKRLETTSTGINVTGAINVNGSALSTAPQITATASGAITAGKPVIVNSNGTVSQVGESFTALSTETWAGTNNEWTSYNPLQGFAAFDSANNRAVVLMSQDNNSDRAMVIAGNVGDGDITWSSDNPVWSQLDNTECWGLVYDDSCSKFIAIVEDSTNKLWAAAVTCTGITQSDISWGTRYDFGTGNVSQCSVCYDSNANVTLVTYRDGDDSNKTKIRALSCNSSGVITLGTAVNITGGTCNATNIAFDSVNNKSLVLYRDASQSNSGRGNVVSVSGTTVSLGSQVTFDNSSPESGSLVFDPDTGKFAYFYYYSTGGDHYGCRIMQISGTSFNYGSSFLDLQTSWNPQTDHRYHSAVYDSDLKQCVVFTRNAAGAGFKGHYYVIDISSSDLTASEVGSRKYWSGSSTTTENNDEVESFGGFYDSTHRRIHHFFRNYDEGGDGHSQALLRTSATSNLTSEGYVGIANASASNTGTATIDVSGASNSSQSSLTPGRKYYVQPAGTLGLTPSAPKVFAGTAVSATKLIVNDQQPAPSGWELIRTDDAAGQSYVEFKGMSNTYAQYKLVMTDLSRQTSSSPNLFTRMKVRFYTDATSGNDGTLYGSSNIYKQTTCELMRIGQNMSNPLNNYSSGAGEWNFDNVYGISISGEFIFPMHLENLGSVYKTAYGDFVTSGESYYKSACFLNNTAEGENKFITGARFSFDWNGSVSATRGKFSWYRLTM